MSEHGANVYRTSRPRFGFVFACAAILLGVPLTLAAVLRGEQFGVAIILMLVMGLPGLFMLLMGLAYWKLRVELGPDAATFTTTRVGKTPWLPWQVKTKTVPYSNITRIDLKERGNPYAPNQLERLAFVRSDKGDFYLNSVWFPKFDELLATLVAATGVETSDEDLDAQPAPLPDGSLPKLATTEKLARGCGWTLIVGAGAMCVVTVLVLVFGDAKARMPAVKSLLTLTIALPAARMLLHYRRPR